MSSTEPKKSASRGRSPSPSRQRRSPRRSPKRSSSRSRSEKKFIQSVKKLDDGKTLKIVFKGEEMDPSFINALRRILLSEVRSFSLMGGHNVLSNTSQVFKNNEYIIGRISQIPIYVKDPSNTSFMDGLQFYICAPGAPDKPLVNEDDSDLAINAYTFQIFDSENNPTNYKVSDFISYDYPILKLRKGEEFHYRGEIAEGVGFYNTTWKTVRVAYKFENSVSTGKKDVKKKSPITGDPLETIEDKRDYQKDRWENPELISLTIRSIGHYDPEVAFRMALDTLEEKLQMFQNLLETPRSGGGTTEVRTIPSVTIENFIQVKIEDKANPVQFLASHTLGNLLRNHMYYRLYDKINGDLDLIRQSLLTYRQPHPLDRIIYLDIKMPPGVFSDSENPSKKLLNDTIDGLVENINRLRKEFS